MAGAVTNPAFLNPADMAAIGVVEGGLVNVRSRHGEIEAVVAADPDLRPGLVAIARIRAQFGRSVRSATPRHNVNRLTAVDSDFDRRTGMPRLGAIPVSVRAALGGS